MSQTARIMIFFGPPGVGKGSVARLCVNQLGWVALSTGDLFRSHVARGTQIGKQIEKGMKTGALVSDSVVNVVVRTWLLDQVHKGNKIILDGFPRTAAQANALVAMLEDLNGNVPVSVIRFNLDKEKLIDRITKRLTCSKRSCQAIYAQNDDTLIEGAACTECGAPLMRRKDDNLAAIQDRLAVYLQHEAAIVAVLKQQGYPVYTLQTDRPLAQVFGQFQQCIAGKGQHYDNHKEQAGNT